MDAFKEALKKKLEMHQAMKGEGDDLGLLEEENEGDMQKGSDLAPSLKEGDVAPEDAPLEMHQEGELSPKEHEAIISAIADSHLGGKGREASSLHERAALKAKESLHKMKK